MNFAISGTRSPHHPISSPAAAKRLKRRKRKKTRRNPILKSSAAPLGLNGPMPVIQTDPKIRRPTRIGRRIATACHRSSPTRNPNPSRLHW